VEVSRLFKAAHLRQAFRGPAEVTAGLPLAQRSYLGALLPESLLHMLESYGPGVFAEALAGDHDTPELVWTHAMRGGRLVPAVLQHIGDFAHRLMQVRACVHTRGGGGGVTDAHGFGQTPRRSAIRHFHRPTHP
jgi:DnaJ family protein C protein 13